MYNDWGTTGGGQRPATTPTVAAPVVAQIIPPANSEAVVVAEGNWKYTVESPQGGSGTLTIKKDGEKYIGSMINSRTNRETALQSVTVAGNELSYAYEVNFGGNTTTITVKSIIDGESMTGTMVVGQFGSFPIKATRTP